MHRIELSHRAERDLREIAKASKKDFHRIEDRLAALSASLSGEDPHTLDIVTLQGRKPWLRLRVGNWRVLFRPIEGEDVTRGFLVARVINRRDLHDAARTLG